MAEVKMHRNRSRLLLEASCRPSQRRYTVADFVKVPYEKGASSILKPQTALTLDFHVRFDVAEGLDVVEGCVTTERRPSVRLAG